MQRPNSPKKNGAFTEALNTFKNSDKESLKISQGRLSEPNMLSLIDTLTKHSEALVSITLTNLTFYFSSQNTEAWLLLFCDAIILQCKAILHLNIYMHFEHQKTTTTLSSATFLLQMDAKNTSDILCKLSSNNTETQSKLDQNECVVKTLASSFRHYRARQELVGGIRSRPLTFEEKKKQIDEYKPTRKCAVL